MDFGAFPPETNSARMYTGPGSASMLSATTAWSELAAELRSIAASYQSIIVGLTSDGWRGPASTAMAASAAPYATWMQTTASQAEHTAAQTQAAIEAYEAAYAMTVPPPVIEANRELQHTLTASNLLGQNSPAIAATEAQYGEMWAQDAGAMYGYAGDSAAASQVEPFATPPQSASGQGSEGQASLAQLQSHIPNTLQSFSSPAGDSGPSGLQSLLSDFGDKLDDFEFDLFGSDDGSGLSLNSQFLNTLANNGLTNPAGPGEIAEGIASVGMLGLVASSAASGGAGGAAGLAHQGTGAAGAAGMGAAAGPTLASLPAGGVGSAVSGGVGALGGSAALGGSSASAAMNRATLVGALSVPSSWAGSSPAMAPTAALSAGTGAAPGHGMPVMPGVPMKKTGKRGRMTPRYGFRPSVIARPPAAG